MPHWPKQITQHRWWKQRTLSHSFSHLASVSLTHGSGLPTMRCLLWQIKYGRNNMLLRILGIKMLWAHKPFCVPNLLIISNMLHSASLTFPWVPRGRLRHLLITEQRGCQTKGGTVRKQQRSLGCKLKNDRMISVHFQGKSFNITETPTSNAEEAEVEWFYEDLQDLLELTPKIDVLFIIADWNAKVRSQEVPYVTWKFGLGVQNEEGQRLIEFCQENTMVIANTLFQQHKRRLYTWTSAAAAAAKSLQLCRTLCDPIDGSPSGSSVPGILQARTLEWVAISFSNAQKWKVKAKSLSRAWLLVTPWTAAYQAPLSMGFPR